MAASFFISPPHLHGLLRHGFIVYDGPFARLRWPAKVA
jgi:hypothetical protein